MEEDKNLQLFYSGLDHALEGAWEEPAPIIPDGWGKTVFTSVLIDLSFYHILFELIKVCKQDILDSVVNLVEGMDVYEDKDNLRLQPGQLYESLTSLSHTSACILLGKIDCTDGDYEELCIALLMKNKSKFVEIIKGFKTIIIRPTTSCIRFLQCQERLFKMSKNIAFGYQLNSREANLDEVHDYYGFSHLAMMDYLDYTSRLVAIRQKEATDLIHKLEAKKNSNEAGAVLDDWIEFDDWLCSYKYFTFFFRYCRLTDCGNINVGPKMAFEYLFKLPAVRGLYDEGMECWKSNRWEEKLLAFESRLQETTTDEGKKAINEIEPPTPQIEKPATVEPQPEQLSAADSNQTPPRSGKRIHSKEIDDFDISPNYFNNSPQDSDDHCKITNEEFYKIDTEKRAKKLEDFIKLLARTGCIDPDKTTMKSCAYAFTGIDFQPYRDYQHAQPVYWHTDKVDILLFICTKLFKKNKKNTNFAKALEVFHVTAKNCTNRAESIIGTEFDVDFTKIFGKLKQSDSTDPSQS